MLGVATRECRRWLWECPCNRSPARKAREYNQWGVPLCP